MAGESIIDYSGQAAIAYQDALNQARNTQNALLRQYGFTAPSEGGYSVESAQTAFDPNMLFDRTTGGVDKTRLADLSANLRIGGTGELANILRAGAGAEADVAAEAQARGFGGEIGGGLMQQRRALAEAQTTGQIGQAKTQFLAGIGEALSPIGGAYQGLQNANILSELQRQSATAARSTIAEPIDFNQSTQPVAEETKDKGYATKGTPGGKPPTNPRGGLIYKGPGGVSWQYRINGPEGRGWYKK